MSCARFFISGLVLDLVSQVLDVGQLLIYLLQILNDLSLGDIYLLLEHLELHRCRWIGVLQHLCESRQLLLTEVELLSDSVLKQFGKIGSCFASN